MQWVGEKGMQWAHLVEEVYRCPSRGPPDVCRKLSFTHLQANHTSLEMLAGLETVSDFLNDRNILVVTLLYLHRVTEFSFAGEAVIYMAINLLVHHKAFPDICNETTMRIHFLNADIAFPPSEFSTLPEFLSIKEDTAVQCSGLMWAEQVLIQIGFHAFSISACSDLKDHLTSAHLGESRPQEAKFDLEGMLIFCGTKIPGRDEVELGVTQDWEFGPPARCFSY